MHSNPDLPASQPAIALVAEPAASASPLAAPSTPLRPKDPDWDDYWAHKVAEKARSRVLAYFGVATLVVGLIGWKSIAGVESAMTSRFEAALTKLEKDLSERMTERIQKFDSNVKEHEGKVAAASEEAMRNLAGSPQYRKTPAAVPAEVAVDLSGMIGKIGDQGREATTVGFSVAYALQAEIKRKFGTTVTISARGIYAEAQELDEWPGKDYQGTSVGGAMKAIKQVGAYLDSQWPYQSKHRPANLKPGYRIAAFSELPNKSSKLIEELRRGRVIVLSITVTQDFDSVAKDGRIVIKSPLRVEGGHSIALVGYDPERSEFRFANMWGQAWGDKGFGFIRDLDLQKIFLTGYVIEELL